MAYLMEVYVDGGCRGNGQNWAFGAAAVCFKKRPGVWGTCWVRELPYAVNYYEPKPTNQRAELTAVIVALQKIIEEYDNLSTNLWLKARVYTDSTYIIGCMQTWIYNWQRNGFINAAGREVANRDLIEEASDLDDQVSNMGDFVEYTWIPREQNWQADGVCNRSMDRQEQRENRERIEWQRRIA